MTGRNDPCPCGSGKKYKRCHGAHEGEAEQIQALYDFDANLLREIGDWSVGRFGQRWRELAAEYLTEETLQFDVPLFMYVVPIDGKTSAEWFSEEQGAKLDPRKRAFLNANTRAWLAVWAVTQVEPGRGVELADLLTKETRKVREIAASRTLSPRDMLLARIIDIEGTSIFAGVHRQPLLPRGAMDVVDELRKVKLVGDVTPDHLRELKTSRLMVAIWEREAADLAERARRGPTPHNTDGDDLMYTADSYTFAPGDRDAVDRALGQFPIVERERPGDAIRYTFLRADNPVDTDGTVIGSAFISSNRLRLESNSVRRADELRERVEAAVGKLLEGHERELLDPLHPPPGVLESEEPAASGPLSGESVREQKERFYQNWADSPIPALGERTPRQAMKSEKYKQRLQLMLREVEGIEARQPEADRFDVSALYDALGLER